MHPRSIHEVPLPDAKVIEAVRQSFSTVRRDPVRLAEVFYEHLFDLAPDLRPMFGDDLTVQHQRMAQALLDVVEWLDNPDRLRPYLQRLGSYHTNRYGVRPEHYPHVGRALVRAVSELAPNWSSYVSSCWILVYEWITANMLSTAESGQAAPRAGGRPRQASPNPRAQGW